MTDQPDATQRTHAKRAERIRELAAFGIRADPGGNGIAGSISLAAGEADKLIKLLRRLRARVAQLEARP